AAGMRPLLARSEERGPCRFEPLLRLRERHTGLVREGCDRYRNAPMPGRILEVGWPVESPMPAHERPFVRREQRLDLSGRPDVELAFLVLAVSIEARVERALGRAHVAKHPFRDAAHRAFECHVTGRTPGVGVERE